MKTSTLKRIDAIERSIAEIDEMNAELSDVVMRYLPFHKNIRLCGGSWDEKITLNLRKSDWPKLYKYCQEKFGNRILGMDINWIVAESR